jgi:hypothetical protein
MTDDQIMAQLIQTTQGLMTRREILQRFGQDETTWLAKHRQSIVDKSLNAMRIARREYSRWERNRQRARDWRVAQRYARDAYAREWLANVEAVV